LRLCHCLIPALQYLSFLSVDIVVPVEPEEVLKFTYGEDWRIPKQEYVWYKEAKNLLRQG